jgi:hypothetical protein
LRVLWAARLSSSPSSSSARASSAGVAPPPGCPAAPGTRRPARRGRTAP